MYEERPLIRPNLAEAHAESWRRIARPGPFWTGAERVAMVAETRASLDCTLCAARKVAVSPFAVDGEHDCHGDSVSLLPGVLVDFIHRIRTDPGRMTKAVFDGVIAARVSPQHYVETISVVCSSVIIDTLHVALDLGRPALPEPESGEPTGVYNENAVDDGAWVDILAVEVAMAATGLPVVPNIVRSMGLVPDAVDLFFATFRPHYALMDIALSISQAQAEFVASRVSALNECFY